MKKQIAFSNYSANEALDIIETQLLRSRTNLNTERVWFYLKIQRNIERAYTDYDTILPLSTLTLLLDKLALQQERSSQYA